MLRDLRKLGKPLSGDLTGIWRYRVGDYRILAKIEDDSRHHDETTHLQLRKCVVVSWRIIRLRAIGPRIEEAMVSAGGG